LNILVTGGAGLIGAAVVERLLGDGDTRVTTFDLASLPARLTADGEQLDAIRGDLGNFSHVLDAVKKSQPQVIYHLGGMLSLDVEADPPRAFRSISHVEELNSGFAGGRRNFCVRPWRARDIGDWRRPVT